MKRLLTSIDPAKRMTIVLVIIVLLPALFLSVYEISSLSTSERLIGQVYRQQLDVLLYSLNQYSWDIAGSWANSITMRQRDARSSATMVDQNLRRFLAATPSIQAVVLTDSTLHRVHVVPQNDDGAEIAQLELKLGRLLEDHRETIFRLERYRLTGYRKLEPLISPDSGVSRVVLMVATGNGYAGMIVDGRAFIEDVLVRRIRSTAGGEFVAAVFLRDQLIFSSEPVNPAYVTQKKLLWLFPDYSVGIALKGKPIDAILRDRFYQTLVLIGLLNVVLLAGLWFIYRSFRREMELVRLKSDFVANISHELRTPLSLIRMYAETLDMGRLRGEKKKREYYTTILGETERLTRLVNNILNFSRMDSGKRNYQMQPADVNVIVRNVLGTYGAHVEHEGFKLETVLGEQLPSVNADREAIGEALINLLDNAMKYSGESRKFSISTRAANGEVVLEVRDHGIGIAREHQSKIFEPFYRASDPHVHNTKGSGLGLAMVHHILDAHGGSVTLQSTPGKGSSFQLHLPVSTNLRDQS